MSEVDDAIRSTINADRQTADYLTKAVTALRIGCDPLEVAESMEDVAKTIRDSIARLEEVLSS